MAPDTTFDDIEQDEPIDIVVQAVGFEEWDHSAVAGKVTLEDTTGSQVELTLFHGNASTEYSWEIGEWYRLGNAIGNYYEGEPQLKPPRDGDISITQIDPPEGTRTTASAARKDGGNPSEPGIYLKQFQLADRFPKLPIHEHRLIVPEGFATVAEGEEGDVMSATAKAAAGFRRQTGSPVTTAGQMRLLSTQRLSGQVSVYGKQARPEHVGQQTLRASNQDDRKKIADIVKQDLKSAAHGGYDVHAINRLVELEPTITSASGDFDAHRRYGIRVRVMVDGSTVCGTEVGYHLRSTFSAAQYANENGDLVGLQVEHDTERYKKPANGIAKGTADAHYTDPIPDLGNISVSEYHRREELVNPEHIDALEEADPPLVKVDYGSGVNYQLPHFLRVSPTLDQLSDLDPQFHDRLDDETRMLPNKRFKLATEFTASLGRLPELSTHLVPTPTNTGYTLHKVDVSIPNLLFANDNRAQFGKQGLEEYGVYRAPSSFKILGLYPEQAEKEAEKFFNQVKGTLREYGAPPDEFDTEPYRLGHEFNYTNVAEDAIEYDAVLAVVPDPKNIGDQDNVADPYPEFKRTLGKENVPSQMVKIPNLSKGYIIGNIAVGLIAGIDGIPWRIADVPGGAEVFIGLDVTYDHETEQHIGASANVVYTDGTILASESQMLQAGEKFHLRDIKNTVKDLLREFVRTENREPSDLVVLRDGIFHEDTSQLMDELTGALSTDITLAEIRKSGAPRIADYNGNSWKIADKGTAFLSDDYDRAFLATTGGPNELTEKNAPGTPRPIQVNKIAGNTSLEDLVEQVYWLSEAHIGSISRSTRSPIPTYYADQCAEFARRGFLTSGELIHGAPYI